MFDAEHDGETRGILVADRSDWCDLEMPVLVWLNFTSPGTSPKIQHRTLRFLGMSFVAHSARAVGVLFRTPLA